MRDEGGRMKEEEGGRTEEGAGGMRQTTVAGMSRARSPYRTNQRAETRNQNAELTVRRGYEEPERSMWVECRECGARRRVPSTNRSELIRAVDAGEIRCEECGERMVEG